MSTYSAKGSEWEAIREQVLIRDNYMCMYCGNEATEVDHVLPRSKGGPDSMDNLVACCRLHNAQKGNKLNVRTTWYDPTWIDHL